MSERASAATAATSQASMSVSLPVHSGGPRLGAANVSRRLCLDCGAALLDKARPGRPRRYCDYCRGRHDVMVRLRQTLSAALRLDEPGVAVEIDALLRRMAP